MESNWKPTKFLIRKRKGSDKFEVTTWVEGKRKGARSTLSRLDMIEWTANLTKRENPALDPFIAALGKAFLSRDRDSYTARGPATPPKVASKAAPDDRKVRSASAPRAPRAPRAKKVR